MHESFQWRQDIANDMYLSDDTKGGFCACRNAHPLDRPYQLKTLKKVPTQGTRLNIQLRRLRILMALNQTQ